MEDWMALAAVELQNAREAWRGGNAGKGRVGSRRAAGMALKAWLERSPDPEYGRSFMHHLAALADDPRVSESAAREAAWRLCARPRPDGDFMVLPPAGLTPMDDAALIIDWARARLAPSEAP